ncbi:unnamed protein product [Medioppia subpectinata]|uniref:Uncharacterized protein n=1 Tax=Medioppia subpectinata TaxID=1979941 RepID=A0A7R9LAL7_9ACAR|nr:unnamed protein product [Medioppia subpectinata]CAG2117253.1 unnamed protein product [Medioppia subpectinata]
MISSEDRCEPGFTDNCFSAVHKDLQLIINSNNTSFKRYTNDYLEKLCNEIDDALNCTSDVIDTDCSEDEGRGSQSVCLYVWDDNPLSISSGVGMQLISWIACKPLPVYPLFTT